jgi:ComEC/Rec2-related protein
MKLPTLWIAAAFVAGIGVSSRWTASPKFCFAAAGVAILLGGILLWRERVAAAWVLALIGWAALGALAFGIERGAVPANHITRLMSLASGPVQMDTSEPLRWRGRLREDPMTLPWGQRYEIELEQVEVAGASVPVRGGLRANLYGGAKVAEAPAGLRAGDRVDALVRAHPPRNFLDPGAFDLRGFLARQNVDLIGSLRSGELLRLIDRPSPTLLQRMARARGDMLARVDSLFAGQREQQAVLRAMLLGDRSFVDSDVVTAFQKTAAYHVLVVAGLHVGALAAFLFWVCRRLRFSILQTSLVTVVALAAYVGIVQDRPPILRAALMAALYLCARPLFRRVELLNTVALAALAILFWKPSSLVDSSFQLSFVAAGVIAGLALPWMDRTSAPYRAGLAHLGDVTRDAAHPPKIAQFRIETRAAGQWLAARLPQRLSPRAAALVTMPLRAGLRLWEIVLLSLVIQWGMLPLLALDFHRVSLAGPLSNIPAVILTGFIVPLGFLTLLATFVWGRLAVALAKILGLCVGWLLATVGWFSRLPRVSYRIPGPPWWLVILFFAIFVCVVAAARVAAANRASRNARRGLPPSIQPAEWIAAAAVAPRVAVISVGEANPFGHPAQYVIERYVHSGARLFRTDRDGAVTALTDGRNIVVQAFGLQPAN